MEGPSIEAVRVIHEAPSGKVTSQPRFDSGAPVIAVLWNSFLVSGRGRVTCAYLLMGNCDERRLSGTGESCQRHASLAKLWDCCAGSLLRHLPQFGFWGFCLKTFAAHKHRCLGVPSRLPEAHSRTSHRRLRLEPRHFTFGRNFWSTQIFFVETFGRQKYFFVEVIFLILD